jgi:hypothetical protein
MRSARDADASHFSRVVRSRSITNSNERNHERRVRIGKRIICPIAELRRFPLKGATSIAESQLSVNTVVGVENDRRFALRARRVT